MDTTDTTLRVDTNPLAGVIHVITGGTVRILLDDNSALPGRRSGVVLDADGAVIGEAYDRTYGGAHFTVHTPAYAGAVDLSQIEFVTE